MTLRQALPKSIPLAIGLAVAALTSWLFGWAGFWLVFPWIGGWISAGMLVAGRRTGKKRDLGRRLAILAAAPAFLVFLGLIQRENLQLEETVFYVAAGAFTRVLIHYAVAKVFGPFIWGRGFCGWACWTAAVLEWLPIKGNRRVPARWTSLRFLGLALSLGLPVALIAAGYDYQQAHIQGASYRFHALVCVSGKSAQLLWFLAGNGLYYALAIPLAFLVGKKRAFCRVLCPVSLVMKLQTRMALIKKRPSGAACSGCEACNRSCPMDVDVMSYIARGRRVASSECILCGMCTHVCPERAIA